MAENDSFSKIHELADPDPIYVEFENDQPFDNGGIAEVYKGKYEKQNVAVKLIGEGTVHYLPNSTWRPTIDQILTDPKNEVKVLKEFEKYFNENRKVKRRIIQLIDSGYVKNTDFLLRKSNYFAFIIIMELGEENFYKTMIKDFEENAKSFYKFNENALMKKLIEPIKVLIQIHKVAIHMDFKPQNLLFEKGKNSILKAIDFGGSVLLKDNNGNKRNKIIIKNATSSPYFLPPEINRQYLHSIIDKIKESSNENKYSFERKFIDINDNIILIASTKTDSWEFGIMILQMILLNDTAINYVGNSNWKKEIVETLSKINNFYTNSEEWIEGGKEQMELFNSEIKLLLEIRIKYPILFLLLSALMNKLPEERLSAEGIRNFLKLKCNIISFLSSNATSGFISMLDLKKRNSFSFTDEQVKLLEKGDKEEENISNKYHKLRIAPLCDKIFNCK
uniref:Protein kinase domain-containing protein n=1 Tax=Meloidogyne enterolobii TaxID=390850 RepID=A0A6V7X8N5_MELEN|nr:unnamed protein product [Meloidogyne enterolobii]